MAALFALASGLLTGSISAAAVTPVTAATVSGKVLNLAGKALVDPWCVYFWPESAEAPGGWARSSNCVETDERGVFSTVLPLGRYKVEVEATNVAYGMFVGGATVDVATTLTVGPKGLKGLKLKVATLAVVSGQFLDVAGKPLVNPNCVYFWFEDNTAETGWSVPDECFEIDPDGYFSAYVAPGKYKLEVQADNIALNTFFGGQNTLATATQLVVSATGLSKQVFKMPTQPPFFGKVTALDGSTLPVPDALYLWTEDATADSGWSVSGDIWDMDSKGTFYAYLVPQKYRIQIVYGTPKVRTFFGGATIEEATTFSMRAHRRLGRPGRGQRRVHPRQRRTKRRLLHHDGHRVHPHRSAQRSRTGCERCPNQRERYNHHRGGQRGPGSAGSHAALEREHGHRRQHRLTAHHQWRIERQGDHRGQTWHHDDLRHNQQAGQRRRRSHIGCTRCRLHHRYHRKINGEDHGVCAVGEIRDIGQARQVLDLLHRHGTTRFASSLQCEQRTGTQRHCDIQGRVRRETGLPDGRDIHGHCNRGRPHCSHGNGDRDELTRCAPAPRAPRLRRKLRQGG
ncbi:MAG: hypothetical protein EB027_02115 [Actinobacteria bacterium]|nr:hypothetical protein [Actinomycetota bacterium]